MLPNVVTHIVDVSPRVVGHIAVRVATSPSLLACARDVSDGLVYDGIAASFVIALYYVRIRVTGRSRKVR